MFSFPRNAGHSFFWILKRLALNIQSASCDKVLEKALPLIPSLISKQAITSNSNVLTVYGDRKLTHEGRNNSDNARTMSSTHKCQELKISTIRTAVRSIFIYKIQWRT